MSKDWRTILRFAAMSFAIAAPVAVLQVVPDSSSTNYSLTAVSILLCPASLLLAPLFAWFFEAAEVGTPGFYILWLFVGLTNAAVYAVIGAAYVGLRKKPEGPTSA